MQMKDTLRYFTGDHPAAQFEQGINKVVLINAECVGAKTLYLMIKHTPYNIAEEMYMICNQ